MIDLIIEEVLLKYLCCKDFKNINYCKHVQKIWTFRQNKCKRKDPIIFRNSISK